MVVSLCLNPSFDLNIFIQNFRYSETNYMTNKEIISGGKGVNFSRIISLLGEKTTNINLIGNQDMHRFYQFLENPNNVNFVNIQYKGNIRTNIKIIESNNVLSEINEISNIGSDYLLKNIIDELEYYLNLNDTLVLSGSVPQGFPENTYEIIINKFSGKCKIIVDSSGIQLANAVKASPYMIKPNLDELTNLAGRKLNDIEDIIFEAKKISKYYNIKIVLVSLSENGSVLVTPNKTLKIDVPFLKVKSAVGAGDALLAGFIKYYKGDNEKEALLEATSICSRFIVNHKFDESILEDLNAIKNKLNFSIDRNNI